MPKTPAESSTIWFNAIPLVITLLTTAMNDQWIASNPKVAGAIASAIFVLNIANRFRTSQAIKL
jgi:hypothetical protein